PAQCARPDPRRDRRGAFDRALDLAGRRGVLLMARSRLLSPSSDPTIRCRDRGHATGRSRGDDRDHPLRARRGRRAIGACVHRSGVLMRRALTWQLIIGAAIIGGWVFLGLAAPLLTNVDPLKSTTLIIDGPRSVLAPYDPGTYGYPLGSDRN